MPFADMSHKKKSCPPKAFDAQDDAVIPTPQQRHRGGRRKGPEAREEWPNVGEENKTA